MPDAPLTFTVKDLGRGLKLEESDPSDRRLRVSYSIFAKVSGPGTTPTFSQGDLVLKLTAAAAETDAQRYPRFVETEDARPSGELNGKTATAVLEVKGLESGFQAWIVDAEVPLLFATSKKRTVTAELLRQGKVVATSKPRDWNPIPLNQKVTKKLTKKAESFPRLSKLICETNNPVVARDLSVHNYLDSTDDLTRLADLTEELFCRVAGGCSFLWSTFHPEPESSSLYGGYSFRQREFWAFHGYAGAPSEILGTLEEQQIFVANEIWARAITEITCFTPYFGSGIGYYNQDRGTIEIYGDDDEDDDEATVEVRSHLEYDLAEGVSGSSRRRDAFYPIVAACEQLTTLVVLSRGWSIEAPANSNTPVAVEIEKGLKAGSVSARTYTTMLRPVSGTWVGADQTEGTAIPPNLSGDAFLNWLGNGSLATARAPTLVNLQDANRTTAFGPGSIAIFSNALPSAHGFQVVTLDPPPRRRTVAITPAEVQAHNAYEQWREAHPGEADPDPRTHPELRKAPPSETQMIGTHLGDNTGAAHIGTILRVDKAGKRFQVLDTGALNTGADYGLWPGLPGIYDYPEATGDMHSLRDPSRGIGLAPVLDGSAAAALYRHVKDVVMRARPLGLMRLVVARRGLNMNPDNVNDWLLYASPLLRMYGSEPTVGNRATYADLIWSLRDFPARDQVRVIWSVRLPTMHLANAMINQPRTSTVTDLVAATKETLLSNARNAVRYTRGYEAAQKQARLYASASDLTAAPGAGSGNGSLRAWLIHQHLGAQTLATARLLSKFTKVCYDMEVNQDGTVGRICSLNANERPTGYSGQLPRWHEAESGDGSGASIHSLQFPLFCESSGGWEPNASGLANWQAQVALMRSSVATRLISRFA